VEYSCETKYKADCAEENRMILSVLVTGCSGGPLKGAFLVFANQEANMRISVRRSSLQTRQILDFE
jgi:hypothetical protein